MRILVVDDEPPARERLCALVADTGLGEVVAVARNGAEALKAAAELQPDVVLMDIRMPKMDGLEAARHLAALAQPPAVIFTTAYDEHALSAFETSAIDYLLKPIRRARLEQSLQRARRLTRAQLGEVESLAAGAQGDGETAIRTHLSATQGGKLHIVPLEDVRFFRAGHKYVAVGHVNGELLLDESLSVLEREFAGNFLRVHRNALVSIVHVRSLEKEPTGGLVVRLADVEHTIEVSRRMNAAVRAVLKTRN